MPSRSHRRPVLAGAVVALVAAGLIAALALGGRSDARTSRAAPAAAATDAVPAVPDAAAAVPDDADPNLAPLPESRARAVEPRAGGTPGAAEGAGVDDRALPKPTGPATDGATAQRGASGTGGRTLRASTATALDNGVALPPLEAPAQVLDVIRAGNIIARSPYKWGGGHGRFRDNGYDCSGSVSYALYYAGLIDGSYTSGALMRYGKPGKGKWITLYANGGHVFMEVAGIRFDTSGQRVTGSRWQNEFRSTGGFVARHPPGL